MKIIQRFYEDKEYGEDDAMQLEILNDKGEKIVDKCFSRCEPEDAYLFRDLNFVYSIPDWLKAAYEAGKNGEPLEITEEPWKE